MAWFFKFTGDDELVAKSKPAFVSLLKSLTFVGGAPAESAGGTLPASHPPTGDASPGMQSASDNSWLKRKPAWEVPADWKEAPAGQFLIAKFNVHRYGKCPGSCQCQHVGGCRRRPCTAISIGGAVNLGWASLPEADINKLVSPLDTPAGKALFVDMAGTDPRSGQKARLVGAILSREGVTWFYKLMGDEQVVAGQKAAFSNFVRSAKYN